MNQCVTTSPYQSENSKDIEENNLPTKGIELKKNFKGQSMSDKPRKLNYTFYNPNTPEEIADYIIKLLIEVNQPKVKEALQATIEEGCSAWTVLF